MALCPHGIDLSIPNARCFPCERGEWRDNGEGWAVPEQAPATPRDPETGRCRNCVLAWWEHTPEEQRRCREEWAVLGPDAPAPAAPSGSAAPPASPSAFGPRRVIDLDEGAQDHIDHARAQRPEDCVFCLQEARNLAVLRAEAAERERDEARAERDAYAANLRDAQSDNAANAEQVSRLSEEVEMLKRAFEERGIRLDAEIASREATLRTVVSERTKAEAALRAADRDLSDHRMMLAAAVAATDTAKLERASAEAREAEARAEVEKVIATLEWRAAQVDGDARVATLHAASDLRAALSPRPSPGAPTEENA